jgi:uncharacterized protein YdeI (YjbR/CyaY-like superfamily)
LATTVKRHRAFRDAQSLRAWLAKNHETAPELWVRIYKKGSKRASVTWNDCVLESLCFGWIDGQKASLDEAAYLQRLTPRTPKSGWSKKNREHVERLINEGRMTPAGMRQVEAAKADGRWDAAYDGAASMVMPDDFLAVLEQRPDAKAFFQTLNRTNLFSIYHRLTTAKKPETRARRMARIVEQLARREPLH